MFKFKPASCVPFTDQEELARCRNLSGADLEKHWNPDFRIKIAGDPRALFIADCFTRIKLSDELDQKLVMVFPNPWPIAYQAIGELISRFKVNCRNVHIFAMDEWADEDGKVAPLDYKAGLGYYFVKYFYGSIDPEYRMPFEQVYYFTDDNVDSYSDMLDEVGDGGADVIYSACGWPGHIAFIDPDTEEFAANSLEEYKQMGSRLVTQHPLTIAENSLFPMFGSSGDVASVPPRAVTIGPRDIQHARLRFDMHSFTEVDGVSSWQRMISRLAMHGPVTMQVPMSLNQELRTDVYVSPAIARPIENVEIF
ncbi:MAG: 6-phosphogluconolactonase [Christensenellales bacterium]|jgi:glucosamine-6-phosphate deaminase